MARDRTTDRQAERDRVLDAIHRELHGPDSDRHHFPEGCADLAIEVQELKANLRSAREALGDERLHHEFEHLVGSLEPRTWSLPPEPGPEVTAVRDRHDVVWRRDDISGWRNEFSGDKFPWSRLLVERGPVMDVSEVTP